MRFLLFFSIVLFSAIAQAQTYNQFSPGGDLGGTWNSQTIKAGVVTPSKLSTTTGTAGSIALSKNPSFTPNSSSQVITLQNPASTNTDQKTWDFAIDHFTQVTNGNEDVLHFNSLPDSGTFNNLDDFLTVERDGIDSGGCLQGTTIPGEQPCRMTMWTNGGFSINAILGPLTPPSASGSHDIGYRWRCLMNDSCAFLQDVHVIGTESYAWFGNFAWDTDSNHKIGSFAEYVPASATSAASASRAPIFTGLTAPYVAIAYAPNFNMFLTDESATEAGFSSPGTQFFKATKTTGLAPVTAILGDNTSGGGITNVAGSTIQFNGSPPSLYQQSPTLVSHVCIANIATLSGGSQSCQRTNSATDTLSNNGEFVLLAGETSVSGPNSCTNAGCNGIWKVNTAGSWSRPTQFPTGQVYPALTNVAVIDTLDKQSWFLTLTSAVTVDTTSQTWAQNTNIRGNPALTATGNGTIMLVAGGLGGATSGSGGALNAFGGNAQGASSNGGQVNIKGGRGGGSGANGNVIIGDQAAGGSAGTLQVQDSSADILMQVSFADGGAQILNLGTPPTGGDKGAGTLNVASGIYDNGARVLANLSGTTSAIGGSALLAGQCAQGTATVTGATSSMVATASPSSDPDSVLSTGIAIYSFVSASNTVTVRVCAIVAVTPASTTYNVRVIQ